MKKKYTAVGVSGIVTHHVHAFDSMDALKKHLATKPVGIMWHIMETVEIMYEGPSSPWDLETSRKLKRADWSDIPVMVAIKRIRFSHQMARRA